MIEFLRKGMFVKARFSWRWFIKIKNLNYLKVSACKVTQSKSPNLVYSNIDIFGKVLKKRYLINDPFGTPGSSFSVIKSNCSLNLKQIEWNPKLLVQLLKVQSISNEVPWIIIETSSESLSVWNQSMKLFGFL